MRRELQALRFAAGERRRGLPQAQVTESHFVENSQLRSNFRNSREKNQCFAHRQLEHFVHIFFAIPDFEDSALESCSAAFFADELDVRQELHLHGYDSFALARFAAASRNIERKMAGRVAALFRFRRRGEKLRESRQTPSDRSRDSIAACDRLATGPPARRLQLVLALDAVAQFLEVAAGALRFQRFVDHVVDERRFSRTGNASDGHEHPQRDHQVDILQVVRPCAKNTQKPAVGLCRSVGTGMRNSPFR